MKFSMKLLAATISAALLMSGAAHAAVTADEAKQLGSTLTPWGAEKAGNKDGSIPAYTGGNSTPPADYKPGSGRYPDPYISEKPLFQIDGKNMDKYADKLGEGTKLMLKRWPSFRLDVYPTHRSATYPKFAEENSIKNATRAKIVNDGFGVEGAYGGIPFPIPKTGVEVLWNSYLRYMPLALHGWWPTYMVDSSGRRTLITAIDLYSESPYYDPARQTLDGINYNKMAADYIEPARSSGEKSLLWYPTNYTKQDFLYWTYSQGQRRVRLAPEAKYDTPIAAYGGTFFFDEIYLFSGTPDRFDWKLVGKKEMYVPYNAYRALFEPTDKVLGAQHINPDVSRWELHRVWVVEATLKEGKRHAYSKRIFYFDEDTWFILGTEGYDHAGKLYRVGQGWPAQVYDPAHPFMYTNTYAFYDLVKGTYLFVDQMGDPRGFVKVANRKPSYASTPEAMAGTGLR